MNKLLLSILISSLSAGSMADMIFKISIPQPDFISNDWDNDGITNDIDNDDDNDGVDDVNDSSQFDHIGQNSTPDVIVGGFHANKTSYFMDEDVTLSWNIENVRSLNLYSDVNLNDFVADVTNDSSIIVNPIGDMTYYMDSETDVTNVSVYQFSETAKNCEPWEPLPSTVAFGEYFDQNRSCVLDFSSNEPSTTQITINEVQSVEGTLLDPVVNYFESNVVSYYPGETITLSWGVDNIRSLNLYSDVSLDTLIGDVTNAGSIDVSPSGDQNYYLDNEVSVSNLAVFEYSTAPQSCTEWLPLASTVFTGQNVNQSRTCSITHTSNEPSTIVDTTNENQVVTGTKAAPVINSFSSNKTSYFSGEAITLNWSVSNKGSLNLYDNAGLTNLVANVSSVNSKSVNPSGNKTYYLKTETGSASKSVYQYNVVSNQCTTWTPAASTVNIGSNANQTRTCTTNYTSEQPSTTSTTDNQSRTIPGTKVVKECNYNREYEGEDYYFMYNKNTGKYSVIWDDIKILYKDESSLNYDGYLYSIENYNSLLSYFEFYSVCRE